MAAKMAMGEEAEAGAEALIPRGNFLLEVARAIATELEDMAVYLVRDYTSTLASARILESELAQALVGGGARVEDLQRPRRRASQREKGTAASERLLHLQKEVEDKGRRPEPKDWNCTTIPKNRRLSRSIIPKRLIQRIFNYLHY